MVLPESQPGNNVKDVPNKVASNNSQNCTEQFDEYCQGQNLTLEDGTTGCMFGKQYTHNDKLTYLCYVCSVTCSGLLNVKMAKSVLDLLKKRPVSAISNIFPAHLNGKKHCSKLRSRKTWPKDIYEKHPSFSHTKVQLPRDQCKDKTVADPKINTFQFDLTAVCRIQPTLDALKMKDLIGLEYMLEILPRSKDNIELKYSCVLCSMNNLVQTDAVTHFLNVNHKYKYLLLHFPTESKTYMQKEIQNCNSKIIDVMICAITEIYGYLSPVQCSLNVWNKHRNNVIKAVQIRKNFSEEQGHTFINFLTQTPTLAKESGLTVGTTVAPKAGKTGVPTITAAPPAKMTVAPKARITAATAAAPTAQMTGAPISEELLKSQLDFSAACLIQQLLNNFKKCALLGLEYLVEILRDSYVTTCEYYCVLCSWTLTKDKVIDHFLHKSHKFAYLSLHFPTLFSAFFKTDSNQKTMKALYKVTKAIEARYGRKLPVRCSQYQWLKYNATILEAVKKREHFSEKMDETFMNTLDLPLASINDESCTTSNNKTNAEAGKQSNKQQSVEAKHKRTYELERKFADEYLQKLTLPLDDGTRGPVSQMWIDRDKKQVLYLCYPCRFSLQSERVAKNHFNGNKHKLKLFSQKFWSKRIYEYSLFKDLKPGYERYEPSQGGVVQTAGTLLATKPKLTAVIDLTDDVLTTDCVIEPKLGCNNVQGPPQVELSASQPDSNDNKEEKSKFDEFIKGLTLVLEDGTRGRVLKPCTRSQDKKDVYLCYPCGVTLLGLETAKNHFKADCHRIQLKSQMTWSKDIYDNHPFDAELNKKEASLVSAVPPDEFVDLTAACVIQPVLDDCNSAAICKSAKKREHFSEKPDLTIIEVLDRSLPSVDIYNSITGEGKGDGNTNDQAQVENKTNPSQVVSAASHPTDDDNKQEESNFAEFLKELTLLLEDGTRGRVFEQRTRSQNKKDIYLCYPCRATLLSPQITKEHLKGKQHQLKLISQNTWSKDIYDNHPFDAKIKKKEASLLSAVPPDEFVDFTAACVIQPVLDDCNSNSLIGLEYLVEIVPIGLPPNYYCVLCPASINKDCVVKHLIGQAHTLRYLSLHFQTVSSAFKQLKISSVEAAKVLDNVTCAIEKKYGRMLPLTCTQLQWHKHNAAICDTVKKRWHFCETPDLTFFEVLPAGENVSSTAGVSGTKEVTKRQNKKDIPTQVVTASGQPVKVDSNKQVVQAKSMCSVLTQQVQPHTVDGKPFIAAQMSVRERKKDTRMTIDQTQCSQIEQKWLDNAIKRLDFYKKYPKSHPQYAREWQKYWYQRYKEVKAENKDPTTYDFKTEWTPYWENRMVQLHEEEIKKKEKAIEEELHLQTYYEKFSARNTPKRKSLNKERSPPHKRVARSRSPRRRPLSAGRRTRSPVRRRRSRSPVQRRRSRSPVHRRRSRSPVQRRRSRSPVQRRRSPLPFCTSPRRLSEDRLSPRRRSRAVLRSPNTKERRHSKSREDLHRSKSREKLWSSNAQYDTKQSRAPNEYHRSRSRSPIAAIRSKSKGSQDRLASRHRSPTRTSLPDLHYKQNTSQPGELNNLTATIMSPLGRTSNKESKKQVNQKKNTIYENTQDDLDNDIMELAYYSKNPEKHPQYNDEWQRFWTRRHKEIKAQNKDPLKHDFEQEWMVFWSEVIVELHEEKIKQKQIIIQKQLDFSLDNSTTFELSTDVTSNTEIYPSRKQKTRSRTPRRRSPSIVWPSCSPLPKHSSSNRRKWTTRSRSRESSRESNNTKKTHHSKSREDVDGKEVTAPMPSGESSWSIKSMRCSRDEAALEGCSPWDESPQEVLSVLPVLRRLVALEDYLGASHASKMLDLFEQALTMEKVKPNSSQDIIEVDSHVMLLEMVKEKLTGKVEMGLVGSATHAVQEVISRTSALLQLAQLRKQRRKNEVETMQFVPGKTDVTTQEMATLVTAAVPRRRAGDKRPPTTTTNYLKKKRRSGADSQTEMSPLKILEDAYEITNKPESRHSEKSSSSEIDAMDGLSDSELKTLMQSFNHLFSDEQDRLVAYVKKLEVQNPKRVKKLRQFLKDDMFAVTCPAPANTAASQTKISANTQVSQQPSVSSDSDDDYLNCLEKVIKVKTEVIQQNEIEKVQQKSQQSRQEQEPPPRATSPPQADVSILFDMVQNISRRSLSFTQGKTASDTCKTDTWSAGGTKLGTDSWLPQTTSVQKNDITEMTVSSGWTQILQTGWDAAQPGQSSVYGDIQHYNVQTNECYQYSNQYPYYYQRQQSTSGLQWNHGSHQNQNWQTQQHGQYPQNRDLSNGGNSYLQDYYLQSENSSQQN